MIHVTRTKHTYPLNVPENAFCYHITYLFLSLPISHSNKLLFIQLTLHYSIRFMNDKSQKINESHISF